jgi:hypothetical protein
VEPGAEEGEKNGEGEGEGKFVVAVEGGKRMDRVSK